MIVPKSESPPTEGVVSTSSFRENSHCLHSSPVDILAQLFPKRPRNTLESLIHETKGDLVRALELCSKSEGSENTTSARRHFQSEKPSKDRGDYRNGSGHFHLRRSQKSAFMPHSNTVTPYSRSNYENPNLGSTGSGNLFSDHFVHPFPMAPRSDKDLYTFPPPPLFPHMYLGSHPSLSHFFSPQNHLMRPMLSFPSSLGKTNGSTSLCSLARPCADAACDTCTSSKHAEANALGLFRAGKI